MYSAYSDVCCREINTWSIPTRLRLIAHQWVRSSGGNPSSRWPRWHRDGAPRFSGSKEWRQPRSGGGRDEDKSAEFMSVAGSRIGFGFMAALTFTLSGSVAVHNDGDEPCPCPSSIHGFTLLFCFLVMVNGCVCVNRCFFTTFCYSPSCFFGIGIHISKSEVWQISFFTRRRRKISRMVYLC